MITAKLCNLLGRSTQILCSRVLTNFGLGMIATLMFFGLVSPAQSMTDSATAQLLRKQLDFRAEIGVIVTFSKIINDSRVDTPYGQEKYVSRLKLAQQSLLEQLPSIDRHAVRQYKFVPQMSINVGRTTLEKLLANPSIKVAHDKPYKILLAESVSRVFPNQNSSPYTGGNQWAVAILDSGVDKFHPFLAGKISGEACFTNRGGAGVPGENSVSTCPGGGAVETGVDSGVNCSPLLTGCDHGTRVAGIAVGSGSSFSGVAKMGRIISIQVTTQINGLVPGTINDLCEAAYGSIDPCVLAFSSDIIAALDYVYAIRQSHNIAAVNLSLGSGSESGACDTQPEKVSIDNLRSVGIATVVAAGNTSSLFEMAVPACVSSAIAVGSTLDTSDVVSSFSNSSVELDYYAPGEIINSSIPGGTFSASLGTSMAAPHVAGAWAVLKHARPSATVDELESLLDNHGPDVTKTGTSHTRKRLALTEALSTLCSAGSCGVAPDNHSFCFSINVGNGKTAVICL